MHLKKHTCAISHFEWCAIDITLQVILPYQNTQKSTLQVSQSQTSTKEWLIASQRKKTLCFRDAVVFGWSSGQKRAPEYFLNSTKSWYMNQLRFLPGEKNWHWWERLQASYTRLKGILWRESSNRLGFHKLPNVSERSSSQRWNLTSLWLFLAQCIPHTASSLFTRWP